MDKWEDCSAFGDIAELEHVCHLLDGWADAGAALRDLTMDGPDYLFGEKSYLIKRLVLQDRQMEELIEKDHPGLYPRTWMASLFRELFVCLDYLTEKPHLIRERVPWLRESFHKVLIAAHDVFDEHHRAALIAAALIEGAKGEAENQIQQKRDAVSQRTDQKMKTAFMDWAGNAIKRGASADNVNYLQGLDGFESKWSGMTDKTLKGWAKDAGFKFKTGRPSKKKK